MGNEFITKAKDKSIVDQCEDILRRSGTKITKPRMAVMQCLATSSVSLSPREILESIEKDDSSRDVDQVSIYRILETFQKLGLVHQVFPSGGFLVCTHMDCQEELHVLINCGICRKTTEIDIPKEIFNPVRWFLKMKFGFTYKNNLFQIDGTCSTCSQN